MDHLLNLSKAAKLAGVNRRTIQDHIQNGDLQTFEGHVRLSELEKVYPEIDPEESAVLERMRRLQDNALTKVTHDELSNERFLVDQIHRLQVKLADAHAEIESYKALTIEMQNRLLAMKKGCDRREKQTLQAILKWMAVQMEQHV